MFETLQAQPADALLGLIKLFAADTRPTKLDLGVGVYKDEEGRTPIFRAVKAAEQILLETQESKAYLGPEGDIRFVDLLGALVFGDIWSTRGDRIGGIQTPGGSGALRIGAELIGQISPRKRILLGLPTWPNHGPICTAAGLELGTYPYFDVPSQTLQFDAMLAALESAEPGDAVLLHGCCHNPTGADLSQEQWQAIADVLERRRLLPFVDVAYHGLGDGLETDLYGVRLLASRLDAVIVAVSCSKNFGLYRDRLGALYALTRSADTADIAKSHMARHARTAYSMPPDHGAAVVRIILSDEALARDWRSELDAVQQRIAEIRSALSVHGQAGPVDLAAVAQQKGMFSTLPLTKEQVYALRAQRAVYMADSGRINVAGLRIADISSFVESLRSL